MQTDFSLLPTSPGNMTVGAPRWPVAASSVSAVAASICALLGAEHFAQAILGYLAGALLVPGLTVIYRFGRRKADQNPFFVDNRPMDRLAMIALMVGIIAGCVSAWFVATELAKL